MARTKKRGNFVESKIMGPDPILLGSKFNGLDITTLNRAFYWHQYYFDGSDARKWVLSYIKSNPKLFGKKTFAIEANDVPMWLGVVCRLAPAGCKFSKELIQKANNFILTFTSDEVEDEPVVESVVTDTSNSAIAHVETVLDRFYNSNYKLFEPKVYDYFRETNRKPKEVRDLISYYEPLIEEVQIDKEAYDHLTSFKKRNYITFLNSIIEEAKLFTTNTRKSNKIRKPRRKKVKSADQLSSKVKFLAEDTKLKLVSLSPSQIVGSNEVWLFNVKYRKLTHLVADTNSQLSIKGTTIIGLNTKQSKTKKIRKIENLKDMLGMGRVSMVKAFDKVKAVAYAGRGRINKDTLILRIAK